MKNTKHLIVILSLLLCCNQSFSQKQKKSLGSGNPIFPSWYADPECRIFNGTYWIYPTYSDDYDKPDRLTGFSDLQLKTQKNTINPQYLKQPFLDAFSLKI